MASMILIIVTTALVNNVVLSQFLGICSFLGVSKQIKTSASLGAAVTFVIGIASAVAYLLYNYFGSVSSGIFADHCFYPRNCGIGTVCRNVP